MEMKKMNNKGFTLIELLAVLVILVVIMSIAIPSITSSVERSKAKQREQVINIVKAQAELYADKHKNSLSNDNIIDVSKLFCDGYLTLEEAKDPMNEKYTIEPACDLLYLFWRGGIVVILPGSTFAESMHCEFTHCGY